MNARLNAEIAAVSPDAELVRRMYVMVGPDLTAVFVLLDVQVRLGQMTGGDANRIYDLFGATYYSELDDETQAGCAVRPEL